MTAIVEAARRGDRCRNPRLRAAAKRREDGPQPNAAAPGMALAHLRSAWLR